MGVVQRVERNTKGRDFVVGDIHGNFTKLAAHLEAIGCKPEAGDRVFSVGDLVDRGPESEDALSWLERPWFFAVRGNHEAMAIDWADGCADRYGYSVNGGSWNINSLPQECRARADAFMAMPVAIELETAGGLVGIVHADPILHDWADLVAGLNGEDATAVAMMAMWSRDRVKSMRDTVVSGVRAVVVGHTPLGAPLVLGNVHHIDTGGWHPNGAGFTVLDAETLRPVLPITTSAAA